MKKISRLTAIAAAVSAASLLVASPATFAHHVNYKADYKNEAPCPPEPMLKDGFYVGLGASYDAYKVRKSTSTSDLGYVTTFNPPLSAKGWDGELFAGYGQYFDYFYIGGELMVSTSSATGSWGAGTFNNFLNYQSKFDARTSYGAALLPGVRVNNASLFYIRLGYVRTDFKARESFAIGAFPFSFSESEWKGAFQYGVGIETLVYDNLSLRGEYTYAGFGDFRTSNITKYEPANNQFVLSLIYHFC